MRRPFLSPLRARWASAEAARREALATGAPIAEVSAWRAERRARRRVLRQGLAVAGAALAAPWRVRAQPPSGIVIVGAGLAGLRCAHALWTERGLSSTVYEMDDRAGGRVETLRGYFEAGQIVEMHGEFISSEHTAMLALVRRFGFALDDTLAYPPHTVDTGWFNDRRYDQAALDADWQAFGYELFHQAVLAAPWPQNVFGHNAAGLAYDHQSVVDWVAAHVPGGVRSAFGQACLADAEGEYGSPAEQQSALNLLYTLGENSSRPGGYQSPYQPMLAGTDEKWHVRGGNDQLISALIGELPAGTVQLSERLVAVKRLPSGRCRCTFDQGGVRHDVVAGSLVLALPFSTLREVDLTEAGLSARKRRAIAQLGYGTNSKILLQFSTRTWNAAGYTANALTDTPAAQTWDCTNYQPGAPGILLSFPAGWRGASLGSRYGLTTDEAPAPAAMAADTLAALEQVFPGCAAAYNGLAYYNNGVIDPTIRGAWSDYLVGQYTGVSGVEALAEGSIHFAGEHTEPDFQGYMEGAVRSGERVAAAL